MADLIEGGEVEVGDEEDGVLEDEEAGDETST